MKKLSYSASSLLVICFLALSNQLFAQNINNYVFSTNQTSSLNMDLNANPIDMTVGTTTLIGSSVINGSGSGLVNFPNNFDCWVMGTKVTSFSVSSHGWLGLSLALTSANVWVGGTGLRIAPLLLNITPNTTNAPAMGTSPTGKVHYKLVGMAPNRTLVVEYQNMTINATLASSTTNDATFQARIYEATGTIEFVYGTVNVSGTSAINGNIGFSNTTTAFQSINPTNHNPSIALTTNINMPLGAYNALSGGGTPTTRRAYIFTPSLPPLPSMLNFTQINSTSITLNWTNNGAINNEIYYSVNGNDWILAATLAPTISTYQLTGLLPSTNYLFRLVAIRESRSPSLLGNASTLIAPLIRSTSFGGSWKNPTTWLGGVLPNAGDSVVIADGATVIIDTTANCYKLTVGSGISGTLVYDVSAARTLNVWESVTINSGASFTAGSGTLNTHLLNIGSTSNAQASGSLINNGTFDMSTTAGVTVNFLGSLNGGIFGTGVTTDFRQITINKGVVSNNRPFLDINRPFTVQGGNTLGLVSNHTAGSIRINGTFTQSNPIYAINNYAIPLNGGLVLNNPNFAVTSTNGNAICNGLLQITQGTFNVSQTAGQELSFGAGSLFIVEGGVINAAARIRLNSSMTFNFSNGVINVALVGNNQTTPSFGNTGAGTLMNWSGGTLNLVQPSQLGGPDYNLFNSSSLIGVFVTGGTLNIGTSATTNGLNFRIAGIIPTLIIDTNITKKTATLSGDIRVTKKIIIPQGTSLNLSSRELVFVGDSIINNGFIDGRNPGSKITFTGVAVPHVYAGGGIDSISSIVNNSEAGVSFQKQVVTYNVLFYRAGPFINSNNIILGNGLNQAVSVQFGYGSPIITTLFGFDVAPTFNMGAGTYTLTYLHELTPRITGNEIPTSRTITNLYIQNSNNSIILSGGNLNITGTLDINGGKIISSDTAMLHLLNTQANALVGGNFVNYIVGGLIRRFPASLSGPSTYRFPIGGPSFCQILLTNTKTNAGGTVDVKAKYVDSLPGGTPDGTTFNQFNRGYFSIEIVSGSANIDSTTITLNQPVLVRPANRLVYSSTLNGTYSSIANVRIGASSIQGIYSIGDLIIPISGSFLAGASKTAPHYTSITQFINDIYQRELQGNVTLLLDTDYVSSNETFPIQLNRFYGNNPNWTITIKPNIGVNAVVAGNSSSSIIKISGAQKYIIDGSNNGSASRNLTIQNQSTAANTAAIWISSIGGSTGSSNNIIRNLRISCGADQTTSTNNTFGVISCDYAAISITSKGNKNDSNQIINNEITRVRYGIFSIGGINITPNYGNRIENNIIGPSSFGANQIGKAGIVLNGEQNAIVDNNEIRFIGGLFSQIASGTDRVGIALASDAIWTPTSAMVKQARITRNKIHDIVDEKIFSAAGILVAGIDGTNNTSNVIANNDIYSISSNGTTSSSRQTIGIALVSGRQDSLLFNTINLNGFINFSTSSGSTSSFGLSIASSSVTNPIIRNNLVTMDVTSNFLSRLNAAINIPTSYVWGTGMCNNNVLFAPANNPQMRIGCIGGSNGTFYQTLSNWQTATGQDMASLSSNPLLGSPIISIPDLASPVLGAGISISGYNRDLLDAIRSNPPSIGAYENPNDLRVPIISFVNLTNDTSLTARSLTSFATIADTSGINNTSGSKPRMYFKKQQDANVFGANNSSTNGWKWVEATNNTSPYSFNINYNLLNTAAAINDTIQYFVVAQDNAPSNNVGSWPSAGFQATSVSNIISAPSALPTYKIVLSALAGNYFVGNAQHFPTISSAMLAAFDRGVSAPVTFTLTDSVYSTNTGEVFPIEIRPIQGASVTNTITLRLDSGVTTTIRDSINGPLLNLNGVNYFSIVGIQTTTGIAKRLTISNTHLSFNAASVRFINDASNNRLESAIFLGANAPTNGNAGVIVFSTGLVTGNDKNSINNCEIGNALANNRPSTLIYSAGSTDLLTKFNDSNIVTNCLLYNYSNPTNEFNAFKILNGNNSWTISDNHVYQTTPITTNALHYVFNMQSSANRTALNNMKILRNFIGGSAPFCSGTPWTLNPSLGRLASLFNIGNTGINEFKGNKICNFLYNSTSTITPLWQVLDYQGGRLSIDSNVIGSTMGRDSIVLLGGGGNETINLITLNTGEIGEFFVRGNSFGAIRVGATLTTTSANLTLINTGINSNSLVKYHILGNILGNGLDGNIVSTQYADLIGSSIRGIQSTNNCIMNIRNNVLRNFTNNHIGSAVSGPGALLHPISVTAGISTITDNLIYNMQNSCTTQLPSTPGGAAVIGILATPSTTGNYIARNRIYGLASTNTGLAGVTVSGIVVNNLTNSLVEGNFIHSLTTAGSGTSSNINGIQYLGGSGNRIFNNMIRLGLDTSGINLTTTPTIQGLHKTGGSLSAFFNSIYLGGKFVQAGANNTFAFSRTVNGTDSIMNNIFMNVRSNNTTTGGLHYAVGLNNTTGLISNYNLIYVDTLSIGDMLARIGTTNCLNLINYKNASFTDGYSVSSDPNFIAPSAATTSLDLHINQGVPTPVERAGIVIPGIATDYDNQNLNGLTPTDIGADAGNFIPLDLSPPQIQYANFSRDTPSTQRPLIGQVVITDISSIATGAFKPRLYYKKKTNANVFLGNTAADNGWKFVEATNTTSPFNFTIDYTILTGGSIIRGDTIQYFVIAQDSQGNTASAPSFGLLATSVSNVTSAPTTPSFYPIISSPLRGTYLIGATQAFPNFTSLTQAVNTLNISGIGANVIFELTDVNYNISTETFPITINEIAGANALNRLTIKPASGVNASIGSSVNAIILNGADFVTIDGSNNGTTSRNLTLSGTTVIWNRSLGVGLGATNNTIRNCSFASNNGISIAGLATGTPGADNDSITIQNNLFNSVETGVYAVGTSNSSNGGIDNLIITNNSFTSTSSTNCIGIRLGGGLNALVNRNTINLETSIGGSPVGISIESNLVSSTIDANNIIKVLTVSSGGYGGRGITIGTGLANSNITISNNAISGVNGSNWNAFGNSSSIGIAIGTIGGSSTLTTISGGINLYNNTVNMRGSMGTASPAAATAALYVGSGASNLTIRNNIFSNTQTATDIGQSNYAVYSLATNAAFNNIDYNNYHVFNSFYPSSAKIGFFGTDQFSLANWRSATGKDSNSVSKAVTFVSTTDAHLTGTSIGDTSLRCLPIPGITRDIDNELRNTTFTYMGADEVVNSPLPVKLLAFNAQAISTDALVTWTTAAEVNNKGFELERSFDGETFEFAQFIEGAGNSNNLNHYQYTDKDILAKTPVVYYRLKQVDYNGRFEYSETVMVSKSKTSSNEVVVYPNPTSGVISLLIHTDIEEHYGVTITDMNGKVVYTNQLLAQQGSNQITLPGSDELISGIYFVRVTGQQQSNVIKLVKTN